MNQATERIYCLAWSTIRGVGPRTLQLLYEQFGSMQQAWEATPIELATIEGIGLAKANTILTARQALQPAKIYEQYLQENPNFWTFCDPEYPRLLAQIAAPPPILHYRGEPNFAALTGRLPSVAIVGTRRISEYGRRWTQRLTEALVSKGFVIISGLAAGIDTIAHQACLNHEGRTIAVLGTGVDQIYPDRNRQLYQQIAEQGLLLSEYPHGTQPHAAHFPQRNRIVAALSRATLVTEAPEKSGALITARLANEYGREVFAVPGSLDNPAQAGCNQLIAAGTAQLVLHEAHLLELLAGLPGLDPQRVTNLDVKPRELPPDLPEELRGLLAFVGYEPTSLDGIVARSGRSIGEVLAALSQLELLDCIVQIEGSDRYQRC